MAIETGFQCTPTILKVRKEGGQLLEGLLVSNYGLGGAYLFEGGHLLEHRHLFKEIW